MTDRGKTEPMRRVAREEVKAWAVVAVVVLLWMGAGLWV